MNIQSPATFDRNKPYNGLPKLPPPADMTNSAVLKKWGLASRALAELKANILRLPNPQMLINTISLQEAKSSTEIENIFTTNDELYKAISEKLKEENINPSTKEVLRYREALWTGYKGVLSQKNMDLSIALGVYQQVKRTNMTLRPSHSQVVIRREGSDLQAGEVIYTPPRGDGIIEGLLDNLFLYMNDHSRFQDDPLIKMAVSHYQFEAIHPFSDGNGRTGRILSLLFLVKEELLSQPVLYLSKYIIQHKEEYYFNLASVTQRGAWKEWIMYMLEAVEQTAVYTNRLINEIIIQMEACQVTAKKELKWYSKKVNELLFSQPYVKPSALGKILDISSRTTLTKYMAELTRLKLLSSRKDGKEVFYINNDLVRILEG